MDGIKKMFFYVIRSYKKIISIFIIIIFILILLAASLYQIKIDDGTFEEDEWSNTPYVASTYTSSANIGSNGITTDSSAKELWEKTIQEGSNIDKYLDSPEELEKLMNAELITQYPKIDTAAEGVINGIIEFERNKTDGTSCKLKYLDKEKFNTYVNSNSITTSEGTSILDYFTIDDSGNAVIAVVNKDTYQITSDDNDITIGKLEEEGITVENLTEENKSESSDGVEYSNVVYNVMSVPINYKDAVQKYTMPFQYLWTLLVMGDDKDFVLELADLVESSEIIISLYDNVTTIKNVDVYNYKKQTRIDKYAKISVENNYGVTGYLTAKYWVSPESPVPFANYYKPGNEATYITDDENNVTITTISESNNFQYYLTKADVWITDYSREYEYNPGSETKNENTVNLDNTAYVFNENTSKNSNEDSSLLNDSQAKAFANSTKKYIEQRAETEEEIKVNVSQVNLINYDHKIDRKRTTTNYETQQKYVEGNVVNNPKVEKKSDEDNFVKILCKKEHKGAKKALTNEVSSWFFEILEKNPDTVNMVDLTKYLFYKATGKDYGIKEFDFSVYDVSKFNNIIIGGDYGDWNGTGTPQDFIKAVAPYAVIDMEQHNIYASVTIAQAIIESGWGKDNIAVQYKNFFGMKAKGESNTGNEFWDGKGVKLNASEGGKSYFRVYDSLMNSIYDHGRNFHVTPTYAKHGVLDCISQNLGPKEQLRRIAISGYAVNRDGSITKPDNVRTYDVFLYEEIIVKYNLQQYDSMSSSDFKNNEGNSDVVSIAKTKLGCKYVWGAKGPNVFDCSGFVYWVYGQIGIAVPGSTDGYYHYKNTTKEIKFNEVQPGDILLIFGNERSSGIGHAGIYVGNDQYIHAPQTGDVVKISPGAKNKFKHVFRFK